MTHLVTLINAAILMAAFLGVLSMIDHMTKATRAPLRIATVLLLVGIIAEWFGYFWKWSEWTDTLFFGGAAMLVLANARVPAPEYGSRWAYGAGVLTAIGLMAAWVTGGK